MGVHVDALALICPVRHTVLETDGVSTRTCPPALLDHLPYLGRAEAKLIEPLAPLTLHVLPRWDSVSNAIRARRTPLCSSLPFALLTAALANLPAASWSPERPLRLWEVGANLGDCSLAAASILRSVPNPRRVIGVLFEPQHEAMAALRKSLIANDFTVEFATVDLAVGKQSLPRRLIRAPISYSAEATFDADQMPPHWHGESIVEIAAGATRTLDNLCDQSSICADGDAAGYPPIDMLKVHVQGAELDVLQGARRTLASGRVCLVLLPMSHVHLKVKNVDGAKAVATGLLRSLPNFSSILVWGHPESHFVTASFAVLVNSTKRQLRAKPKARQRGLSLVAWRSSGKCARSPAVRAAESMWPLRDANGHITDAIRRSLAW